MRAVTPLRIRLHMLRLGRADPGPAHGPGRVVPCCNPRLWPAAPWAGECASACARSLSQQHSAIEQGAVTRSLQVRHAGRAFPPRSRIHAAAGPHPAPSRRRRDRANQHGRGPRFSARFCCSQYEPARHFGLVDLPAGFAANRCAAKSSRRRAQLPASGASQSTAHHC